MVEENKSASSVRGRWTKEEQNLFNLAYQWHGKDWKKLAEIIRTRTIIQIRSHAQKIQKKLENKGNGEIQAQKVYILEEVLYELNSYISNTSSNSCKKYMEYQNALLYTHTSFVNYEVKNLDQQIKGELYTS